MTISGKSRAQLAQRSRPSSGPGNTYADRQRYVRHQQQQGAKAAEAPKESMGDKLLKLFGFKSTTFAAKAQYTDTSPNRDFANLTSSALRRPKASAEYINSILDSAAPPKKTGA